MAAKIRVVKKQKIAKSKVKPKLPVEKLINEKVEQIQQDILLGGVNKFLEKLDIKPYQNSKRFFVLEKELKILLMESGRAQKEGKMANVVAEINNRIEKVESELEVIRDRKNVEDKRKFMRDKNLTLTKQSRTRINKIIEMKTDLENAMRKGNQKKFYETMLTVDKLIEGWPEQWVRKKSKLPRNRRKTH